MSTPIRQYTVFVPVLPFSRLDRYEIHGLVWCPEAPNKAYARYVARVLTERDGCTIDTSRKFEVCRA